MPKTQGRCATEGCDNLQAPRGSGATKSYRKHCKKCRRLSDQGQTAVGQTTAPEQVPQELSSEVLAVRRANDLAAIAQNKAVLELSDEDLGKWMVNKYTTTVIRENYHKLPRAWQNRLGKGASLRPPHVLTPSPEQLASFRTSLTTAIANLEKGLGTPPPAIEQSA